MTTRLASAALALLVLLPACSRKQSDEEQLRSLVTAAVHAAEEKRVGDVMEAVSERFAGEGLDKRGVKQLVAFHVLRESWVALTVSGDHVAVRGDAATATVDVVMIRSGPGRSLAELLPHQASVYRFDLKLNREDGDWKVTSAKWRPISLEAAADGPRPAR